MFNLFKRKQEFHRGDVICNKPQSTDWSKDDCYVIISQNGNCLHVVRVWNGSNGYIWLNQPEHEYFVVGYQEIDEDFMNEMDLKEALRKLEDAERQLRQAKSDISLLQDEIKRLKNKQKYNDNIIEAVKKYI